MVNKMHLARILIWMSALYAVSLAACSTSTAPLLTAMFSNLGSDCDTYVALYASSADYYHQRQGYKNKSGLQAACEGYGTFCDDASWSCSFQQNGQPYLVENGDRCEVLAPFLWSRLPAQTANIEPHSGFIHNTLIEDSSADYGYLIETFREIEDSFSVPYNWGNASDASAQKWTIALLNKDTASAGECDAALAPFLTHYFAQTRSSIDGNTLYRQQGNAEVIASGGLCHVLVPYAAAIDGDLQSGRVSLTLQPDAAATNLYTLVSSVNFPSSSLVEEEQECASGASMRSLAGLASILLSFVLYAM